MIDVIECTLLESQFETQLSLNIPPNAFDDLLFRPNNSSMNYSIPLKPNVVRCGPPCQLKYGSSKACTLKMRDAQINQVIPIGFSIRDKAETHNDRLDFFL